MASDKRSIYSGQDGEGVSDINKQLAADAEADARKALGSTSIVPVNQLEEDYVPLEDGSMIRIRPKQIANNVNFAINLMLSDQRFSFLRPYLSKPVIWTYEARSAFTDGIRIFMSPLFANTMLQTGSKINDAWIKDQTKNNPLYIVNKTESNWKIAKLVIFVIVHECYHVLYQHIKRERLLIGKDSEKHKIANIAADLEINRDIESCFEELRGSTNDIDGVWWENAEFEFGDGTKVGLKKGEKLFTRDVFEDILTWMLDHNVTPPSDANESPFNDNSGGNTNDKSATYYGKGWDKAVRAIQTRSIDPENIKFI